MAKITSSILQKIAPQTKSELRDRFLPYLNEALPRYGIINELQVAGFLATAAFESQYFQKTKEGKARASSSVWIKYQSKYWATNFMGRGIFQTTHLKNYRTFGQKMKAKGIVSDSELFVKNPELLEQPQWAVESACEYWETNGLDRYARQGFKGFSALQGRVNKGSAEKVAHDYPNRLIVYERTRLALPDDFTLDSKDSTAQTANSTTESHEVVKPTGDTSKQNEAQLSEPSSIQGQTQIAETIVNSGATGAPPPSGEPVTVTVERTSVWAKIGAGIGVITGFGINFATVIENKLNAITAQQMLYVLLGVALIALALYLYDRAAKRAHEKTLAKVDTASDPAKNTVELREQTK